MDLVRIDLDLLDEDDRNLLEDIRHEHYVPWSIFLIEVLENYANVYRKNFIDLDEDDDI